MTSSHNLPLLFSKEAQEDVEQILQYSLENWGQPYTQKYGQKLDVAFRNIQTHPNIGKLRDDILPDYRMFKVEKYLIFYWLRSSSIVIVRVLHERQDLSLHF